VYALPLDITNYCAATSTNSTSHTYYTLLAAPHAPMDEPWTSVLDYACSWANGQNTFTGATSAITQSLYSSGFYYESNRGAPGYGDTWSEFLLNDFLSDLGSSYAVNCLDMAKAVVTFANAFGATLTLSRFHSSLYVGGDGAGYPLNYIDPIGSAPATNNTFSTPPIGDDCRTGGFGYHAFAENGNNYIWDATLRYDMDMNPDNVSNSNPSCGDNTGGSAWELPCNIAESSYLGHLIDNWTKYNDLYIIDCGDPYDCGYFDTNGIYVE
jgi:hypothetical protein